MKEFLLLHIKKNNKPIIIAIDDIEAVYTSKRDDITGTVIYHDKLESIMVNESVERIFNMINGKKHN